MSKTRPCLTAIVVAAAFVAPAHGGEEGRRLRATPLEPASAYSLAKTPGGEVSVIVKLDVDAMASYRGGVAGLAPTSPRATGARRLDPTSAQARAYESFLVQRERSFEQAARAAIPRARVVHRFRRIMGGVSMVVPRDRVADLARLPGVKAVYPDELLPLDTDRSPEFIGAPALWARVGGQDEAGEGVIVGIIDTGIWPEHPSVADDGSYPEPPDTWTGTACQFGSSKPGDAPFACNNKLIGASRHMSTFDTFGPAPLAGEFFSARDNNGHGSHTATTAAGNADVLASTGGRVSGIAPRAHVAAYKVCFTVSTGQGSCYSSDSMAAIEQAIEDGVDVMNFSIGGGTSPYSDVVSLAFLDAYAAGVFVAASAGNTGPGADTVGHREPWVTTAAATTTDKSFVGHADLAAGGATLAVTGVSATDGAGPAPVVLSAGIEDGVAGGGTSCPAAADDEAEALCCNPFPPGTFTGQIVVCKRGTNARVQKSYNVMQGGAAGMILYNAAPGTLNADIHSIPSLHVDHVQGASLLAFLAAQSDETATLVRDDTPGQGDVVASFSSRGGPAQTLGISKPDVGAPGVDILAGQTPMLAVPAFPGQADLFQIISGTSMASPHVAGAGALLRQLHPEWTPGEIKSALMMTATTESTVKEDGATPTTPFDIGSGRIDLAEVGSPGLTISDTAENYILLAGNLSTSNYPSLYIPVLAGKVVVERTLKSVDRQERSWKLRVDAPEDLRVQVPREVTLRPGAKKRISILVDASRIPIGETRHATLRLESNGREGCHGPHLGSGRDDCADTQHWRGRGKGKESIDLVFPITIVRRQGDVALTKACDPLVVARGATTTCTIDVANTTYEDQEVTVFDHVPPELDVRSVSGGGRHGNTVFFHGTLSAAVPPQVSVADRAATVGYLPLSLFGIAKNGSFGDETIVNFSLTGRAIRYAGNDYAAFGVTSNGYVVLGGGTASDVAFLNQNLPSAARPNNVLAPFWTDLNPGAIPAASTEGIRVGFLTDGVNNWVVVDWNAVPNFGSAAQVNSFQVWMGVDGTEDIFFTYGVLAPSLGDGGLLTVGAENVLGNSGENYYYNGTGTAPSAAVEVVVTGAAAEPGETHTITFGAAGVRRGEWRNCAQMTSDAVFGTAMSCAEGEVVGRHP
jgi:subtilisin family serine protease